MTLRSFAFLLEPTGPMRIQIWDDEQECYVTIHRFTGLWERNSLLKELAKYRIGNLVIDNITVDWGEEEEEMDVPASIVIRCRA